MIDIHPPHHAATTWRDFLIHIATICIGLLIAIGLEQTVEFFHHRHQAAELRESLHAESQQILSDTSRCITAVQYRVNWLSARIDQVKRTVWSHQPLAAPAPLNPLSCAAPDDPIWRTAKESGLAFYLTNGEITGDSEIEYVISHLDRTKVSTSGGDINQFLAAFPSLPNGQPDLSAVSPEDLHRYLTLLTAEDDASTHYLLSLHQIHGAVRAVAAGETGLNAIYHAEYADVISDPLLRSFHQHL